MTTENWQTRPSFKEATIQYMEQMESEYLNNQDFYCTNRQSSQNYFVFVRTIKHIRNEVGCTLIEAKNYLIDNELYDPAD